VYLPGCPPSADMIFHAVVALLEKRTPEAAEHTHFGG
jgi:coenzyme F420-reducing hydrogenase gamma subunit